MTASGAGDSQAQGVPAAHSLSLGTAAARNLATTVKSLPQMREITSRHLLRVLPWVEVTGGTYRLNRRLNYRSGWGLRRAEAGAPTPQNKYGEAAIELAAGHVGEVTLPGTFVDYELEPREYELSVAQTILRVHTRVGDMYSEPMDQIEQQLRLTIEALRERQEHELVNNRDFGLLHNADPRQRIRSRTGWPTPDDLDELLCRRRKSHCFVAHPRAIAAFARQCNRRGIYPDTVEAGGSRVTAWRGVPILPCDKIPISGQGLSSVIVMRIGEEDQGVIGLRRTGLPDEYQPGLSVRLTGVDDKAIASYLLTTYYSAAVLVPDALGILEGVDVT
ncbi:family 2B encapsulin nanocompartment shell protein [Planotetraspora sp. A-T 1434]|uniref:family 2B encapsulin nanocompartment shell protein n=1 Tax=Planotetraspora sp. A-T 1434 TaxID=2979219 RepID=UPI0021C033F2|nr:family 2B encapsulin nanocompartment shell protein [Planotetraspora sp. A-T 1434]MCT9933633.1 family 2B encapsulin nanocompartment shell protein [Planotetraspora sp. A-T 1434]